MALDGGDLDTVDGGPDPARELLALQCHALACAAALAGVEEVLEPGLADFLQ